MTRDLQSLTRLNRGFMVRNPACGRRWEHPSRWRTLCVIGSDAEPGSSTLSQSDASADLVGPVLALPVFDPADRDGSAGHT